MSKKPATAALDGLEGPTVSDEDQAYINDLLGRLKVLELKVGTEHPTSLEIVIELARIFYRTRQLDKADHFFYRAFCGAERTHRKTHIIVYRIASTYGVCLYDMR